MLFDLLLPPIYVHFHANRLSYAVYIYFRTIPRNRIFIHNRSEVVRRSTKKTAVKPLLQTRTSDSLFFRKWKCFKLNLIRMNKVCNRSAVEHITCDLQRENYAFLPVSVYSPIFIITNHSLNFCFYFFQVFLF